MAKLSILKRNGDMSSTYSTYLAASQASVAGDVIQIWADLDEQILLKNGVDIWIMPGVVLNNTTGLSPKDTITDKPTGGSSQEVHCKIYGQGRIINTSGFSCVFIDKSASELSMECDYVDGISGKSIYISHAAKFHITCNYVYNRDGQAIQLGEIFSTGLIQDVNINISKVETGNTTTPYTGTTAIITRCNGFMNIDEIICRNLGHCLSHREGSIVARIKKLTTTNNYTSGGNAGSTVIVAQYNYSVGGLGTQKLILYFEEILALTGQVSASLAIEHHEGTGIFIGRYVYSDSAAAQISEGALNAPILPKGYLKINNIKSATGAALVLNDFTDQITIDSNFIEGNSSGDGGVIFSFGAANFVIRNARIKNTNTGSSVKGMGLFEDVSKGTAPNVTLNKVKIISNGPIIFYNSSPAINISNFGLFGTVVPGTNVNLKIGPKPSDRDYNYQCIIDDDLT